jgi:hypothetical protein
MSKELVAFWLAFASVLTACGHAHSLSPWPPLDQSEFGAVTPVEDDPRLASICHLSVLRRYPFAVSSWKSSTGVIVGPGLIATAGHNVADFSASDVEEIHVVCGRARAQSAGSQGGREDALAHGVILDRSAIRRHRYSLPAYDRNVFDLDIALLRVPTRVTGAVAPRLWRAGDPPRHVIALGFPDRADPDYDLERGHGEVVRTSDSLLAYRIATRSGMSGGPVFECEPHGDECVPFPGARLVGIHVGVGMAHRFDERFQRLLDEAFIELAEPPTDALPEDPVHAEPL